MTENTTYKAAIVQAEPAWLDLDNSIGKCCRLIAEAAAHGAELVAFPETFIPGYPYWIWLGTPAWGMQFVARYHENSLSMGDEGLRRLQDAARDHSINVVLGYSERSGGSLYIGQAIVDASGRLIASRRKLKPTHVERSVFGEGSGRDLAVHDLALGRVGALSCWEHIQPLNKYALFTMHEQVHIAAWPSFALYPGIAYALGPEVNVAASQMYAVEGQCFVLAACGVVGEDGRKLFCDTPERAELLQRGGGYAMAFGPDGRPLADPLPPEDEGILYADIDLSAIALAKAAADPVGHYARPDVTRLLLNPNAAPVVETLSDPEWHERVSRMQEVSPDEVPRADGDRLDVGAA